MTVQLLDLAAELRCHDTVGVGGVCGNVSSVVFIKDTLNIICFLNGIRSEKSFLGETLFVNSGAAYGYVVNAKHLFFVGPVKAKLCQMCNYGSIQFEISLIIDDV